MVVVGTALRAQAALTSHEEEKSSNVLHQIMLLTAAQHAYDPAEQDDGDGHADETRRHPLEVCKRAQQHKIPAWASLEGCQVSQH